MLFWMMRYTGDCSLSAAHLAEADHSAGRTESHAWSHVLSHTAFDLLLVRVAAGSGRCILLESAKHETFDLLFWPQRSLSDGHSVTVDNESRTSAIPLSSLVRLQRFLSRLLETTPDSGAMSGSATTNHDLRHGS